MKYGGVLLAVADIERSKRFYHDVLRLEVIEDFGANIVLTGNVFLQSKETWEKFICGKPVSFGSNDFELYFEADDIDGYIKKLDSIPGIKFVHPLIEHSWGQRVVRFYDPDYHIIEVGENMDMVVKRFLKSGLSVEETAKRMDVSVEYVHAKAE